MSISHLLRHMIVRPKLPELRSIVPPAPAELLLLLLKAGKAVNTPEECSLGLSVIVEFCSTVEALLLCQCLEILRFVFHFMEPSMYILNTRMTCICPVDSIRACRSITYTIRTTRIRI